jgi:hypothetical protein
MAFPSLRSAGRAAIWVLAGAAAMAAPLRAQSQALVTPAESGPWYKRVQVDLFGSLSYTCNANHPDSNRNDFRIFDFDDDQAKLDVVALTVQKAAVKAGEFGFRVDLGAGQSIPEITAARGLFRNAQTGEAGHFDVEQAYVSYIAKVGRGLRFDLGKFYAPVGYESVDRYDAYNDNFTRSFLFGYSAPFTTTGLKVSYPFSDKVSGMVMAVQGWDNVNDNNTGKTIGAQVVVTPVPALSLTMNYIGGPEQDRNNANWRNVLDFCATWKATDTLSFGLNADFGHESGVLDLGASGRWDGAAFYAVVGISDRFGLALRAERLNDYDGARTGSPQRLGEVTLTPSYKISGHFLVRADLRQDWSDKRVFQKGAGMTDRQFTASLNLLLIF